MIGAGYHREKHLGPDDFFQTWIQNIAKLSPSPERVVIIADSGCRPPLGGCWIPATLPVEVNYLTGDLGNCHMLLHGVKNHRFSGWTGAVCSTAMTSYCNETDMIWFEQDVLAFGPIIEQVYAEIKDAGIIFGKCSFMQCEQSFFLVRHWYLTEFIRLFLGEGPQNCEDQLGEQIFVRLLKQNPDKWFTFDIKFGRDRPLNYDEPVWYAQKYTPQELEELKRRNMI